MPIRNMSDKITAHENAHAAMMLSQYMADSGIAKPVEVDRQCLVSDGMTSSILRGKAPYPTVRFMMRMAHGIGIPLDDFLGDGLPPVAAPEPTEAPVDISTSQDATQQPLPLDTSMQPLAVASTHASTGPMVSHIIDEYGAFAFATKLDGFLMQLETDGMCVESIHFSSTGVHTYRGKEHYAALVLTRKRG